MYEEKRKRNYLPWGTFVNIESGGMGKSSSVWPLLILRQALKWMNCVTSISFKRASFDYFFKYNSNGFKEENARKKKLNKFNSNDKGKIDKGSQAIKNKLKNRLLICRDGKQFEWMSEGTKRQSNWSGCSSLKSFSGSKNNSKNSLERLKETGYNKWMHHCSKIFKYTIQLFASRHTASFIVNKQQEKIFYYINLVFHPNAATIQPKNEIKCGKLSRKTPFNLWIIQL